MLIIFKKISYRVKVNVPYLLFSNMYLLFVESASRCSKLCWLGGHAEKREMKGGDPPTFFASSPRWRGGEWYSYRVLLHKSRGRRPRWCGQPFRVVGLSGDGT